MAVFRVDDFIKADKSFVKADDIVENLLVDFVGVLELAEIDTLGSAHNLDFSGTGSVRISFTVSE
jgi:hypothetical protein